MYTQSVKYVKDPLWTWKNFVERGITDAVVTRPEIMESWQRCRVLDVDPYDGIGKDRLGHSELQQLFISNSQLVEVAKPFMHTVYQSVQGSGFMVVITDKEGRILHTCGDTGILDKAASTIQFIKGTNWSEQAVGTNAIGTALVINKAIQISGPEHFCQSHHYWTCSGAPIHNYLGEIIGCFDISGPAEYVYLHTYGMVVAAVEAIENQLRKEVIQEEKNRAYELLSAVTESVTEGLLAVDNEGRIIHINLAAQKMLRFSHKNVTGEFLNSLLGSQNNLTDMFVHHPWKTDAEMVLELSGESIQFTCSSRPITQGDGSISGVVFTLLEINKVRRLVNRMVGATARFYCKDIIGESEVMKKALKLIFVAANSRSNVLLTGESGTGKELFAQAIHNHSGRSDGPFVAVNCAALPRELIQSELFGYNEGAFTGAKRGGNPGKFELANEGTLFLDEIGDMPIELQVNLLRVLQERKITRVGGNKEIPVDVRIIAATNKNLLKDIEEGRFRQDLFYRLNVFSIHIPPLREREEDIELLTMYLIRVFSESLGKQIKGADTEFLQAIRNYSWPGNVRELQNAVEFAINIAEEDYLTVKELPRTVVSYPRLIRTEGKVISLLEVERITVESTLNQFNGNITQTAKALGIGRNTLYDKLKKLGVRA
ncbi:sigma-54-dependent Fis family transcriptional regulator [Desulfosporosinus fructosivorans]|uniref:Sigma-54-dependent Fis family transcriptional regulator n=1 Tax=Desulfosporosinus fructosivorans TaxID=2018669 RepID=A0A4Z0R6X7_9FIRM|nr:sigma-54-dependent Fis family transcriptional regulator [Desulfosporosinus fructosivorans]TGE38304.1 sigma-54-dependent Fis family transcriptional regulator [Desulfosporosinus fructosivorans]